MAQLFLPSDLPDPGKPVEEQELSILFACVLFGEIRSGDLLAIIRVADVALERERDPRTWWGHDLREVLLKESGGWHQFSALNEGDPNRAKLLEPLRWAPPGAWWLCLTVAERGIAGKLPRQEPVATHYYARSLLPDKVPAWTRHSRVSEVYKDQWHVFSYERAG